MNKGKYIILVLLFVIPIVWVIAVVDSSSGWDSTFGDCDELCTVYRKAQQAVMKKHDLYYRNFPNRTVYRDQIEGNNSVFYISSWFYELINDKDTIILDFCCNVRYDQDSVNYVVSDLVVAPRQEEVSSLRYR